MTGALALAATGPALAAEAPVVLELFTSQGCSSCPPADALLGELVRQPNVIGLAWHVDYWNRLGWPDPWASPQWTERQRTYARQLRTEVYTPALVVNGTTMVVGSDRRAVATAMRDAPALMVSLSLSRDGTRLVAEVGALPPGATLALAVVDPERSTAVGAGENSGRKLREFRIVREYRPLEPRVGQSFLPGIAADQAAVLLVQDGAGRVLGAAAVAATMPHRA
jgi:hypothetical protein